MKLLHIISSIIVLAAGAGAFLRARGGGERRRPRFYYLVREQNGAATVEYLAQGSSQVSAEWLDPGPQDSTTITNIALHRGRMEGGRYLLLGERVALDVQTLKAYPVREPDGAYPNQFKTPISFSPDRTSFVRFGSGESPENKPVFIVFDFAGDTSYTLPVDRSVMRYNSWEEMDRTWFDHYFEWKPGAGGHDRLAVRQGVVPLPYKGQLSIDQYDSTYIEYNLLPVKPEMQEIVVSFIAKEFGGKRQPLAQYSTTPSLLVGEDTVSVLLHEGQVGVFMDRGGTPRSSGISPDDLTPCWQQGSMTKCSCLRRPHDHDQHTRTGVNLPASHLVPGLAQSQDKHAGELGTSDRLRGVALGARTCELVLAGAGGDTGPDLHLCSPILVLTEVALGHMVP